MTLDIEKLKKIKLKKRAWFFFKRCDEVSFNEIQKENKIITDILGEYAMVFFIWRRMWIKIRMNGRTIEKDEDYCEEDENIISISASYHTPHTAIINVLKDIITNLNEDMVVKFSLRFEKEIPEEKGE